MFDDESYSQEYREYLERYELFGEGRRKLSPEEFEEVDDKLLELLAYEASGGVLTPEEEKKIEELEYLLIAD
ncbi:MAG: hypothetical protein ACE5NP_08670 [Anaerolineae bacterium]